MTGLREKLEQPELFVPAEDRPTRATILEEAYRRRAEKAAFQVRDDEWDG